MPNNFRSNKHSTRNPFAATPLCTIALLAGLLASATGCSRPGGPAAPGEVRFDLAADPRNLNPLFSNPDAASVEQQVARLAFEPFVDLDARGRPIPALLDRIPTTQNGGLSADGRTIRYELRRSARWSDGVPVSAQDVLFTLRAITDPRNPVRSHEGYDLIRSRLRDRTASVVFHLRHAWAPAVTSYFSYGFSPQFVLPAHVLSSQTPLARAAFNADPSVGDDPFTFVSWRRGEGMRLGKPALLARKAGRCPTRRSNRAGSGRRTYCYCNRASSIRICSRPRSSRSCAVTASLRFTTVPTAVVAGLALDTSHAPLDDVQIRRALAMSVDREAVSRKITLGLYPVPTCSSRASPGRSTRRYANRDTIRRKRTVSSTRRLAALGRRMAPA